MQPTIFPLLARWISLGSFCTVICPQVAIGQPPRPALADGLIGTAVVRGETLKLSAPVAGRVQDVTCRVDDVVQAEQLLLSFDSQEVDLALRQAEVEMQRAQANVERSKALVSQAKLTVAHRRDDHGRNEKLGSSVNEAELRRTQEAVEQAEIAHVVAYQDYQQALHQLHAAELRCDQVRIVLTQQRIVAPMAGQVVGLEASAGERVDHGAALLELRIMDKLHCDFQVAEATSDLRSLIGRTIMARFTVGGEEIELGGEVLSISGEVNAHGMVAVRVCIHNELRDGRWLLSHGKQVALSLP